MKTNPRCCTYGCNHPPYTVRGLLKLLKAVPKSERDKFVEFVPERHGDEAHEWDGTVRLSTTYSIVLGRR